MRLAQLNKIRKELLKHQVYPIMIHGNLSDPVIGLCEAQPKKRGGVKYFCWDCKRYVLADRKHTLVYEVAADA